jgi:hypothetical protein
MASWNTITSAAVAPILGSGCTYELARDEREPWAQAAHFERMFIYCLAPGETSG